MSSWNPPKIFRQNITTQYSEGKIRNKSNNNIVPNKTPGKAKTYGMGQTDQNQITHHFDSKELKRERLRQASLARFDKKK